MTSSSSTAMISKFSDENNNSSTITKIKKPKDLLWGTTWNELDKTRFYGAMLFGSVALRLIIYPIHFAKTRVQYHGSQNVGAIKIIGDVIKQDGFFRLYRGAAVFIATGIISAPIFLSVLERSRAFYVDDLHFNHTIASTLSAITASLTGQLILVPSDNVVQRLMVGHKQAGGEAAASSSAASNTTARNSATNNRSLAAKVKAPFQCLAQIYKDNGLIRGVYRGFSISVLSYTPTSALFWTIYGNFRLYFENTFKYLMVLTHPPHDEVHHGRPFNYDVDVPKWKRSIVHNVSTGVCAYGAGAISNALTTPFDAIKTRAQLNNQTAVTAATELYKDQGLRGFTLGGKMRMFSGGFMFSLFLLSYEQMKIFATKSDIQVQ